MDDNVAFETACLLRARVSGGGVRGWSGAPCPG